MTKVDQVADGVYRISTLDPQFSLQFNQFLIDDDQPALIHTGMYPMYEAVRKAIGKVLDPARLSYIIVPHFEADECGGMGRFAAAAPKAVLVCSELGSLVNLSQWDFVGPVRGMRDGDTLELGKHRLRFWETPHVHHWDSMMVVDETTQSLFPADLFIQPGDQPVIVRENLGKEMCEYYRQIGIFAARDPVIRVANRVKQLDPQWIHPMHGGSLPQAIVQSYNEALYNEPFIFEGKLLGRELPG